MTKNIVIAISIALSSIFCFVLIAQASTPEQLNRVDSSVAQRSNCGRNEDLVTSIEYCLGEYTEKYSEQCAYKCFQILAEKEQDEGICRYIEATEENEIYRSQCFTSVARVKDELEICDLVPIERGLQMCYLFIAEQRADVSVCDFIDVETESGETVHEQCQDAVIKQGEYDCGDLINENNRNSCYRRTCTTSECCSQITNESEDIKNQVIQSCLLFAARQTGDLSLCDDIEDEEGQQRCMTSIADSSDIDTEVTTEELEPVVQLKKQFEWRIIAPMSPSLHGIELAVTIVLLIIAAVGLYFTRKKESPYKAFVQVSGLYLLLGHLLVPLYRAVNQGTLANGLGYVRYLDMIPLEWSRPFVPSSLFFIVADILAILLFFIFAKILQSIGLSQKRIGWILVLFWITYAFCAYIGVVLFASFTTS